MSDLTDKNLKDKIIKEINEILFDKDLDSGKISIFSKNVLSYIGRFY